VGFFGIFVSLWIRYHPLDCASVAVKAVMMVITKWLQIAPLLHEDKIDKHSVETTANEQSMFYKLSLIVTAKNNLPSLNSSVVLRCLVV
jgi:hypothetical protein